MNIPAYVTILNEYEYEFMILYPFKNRYIHGYRKFLLVPASYVSNDYGYSRFDILKNQVGGFGFGIYILKIRSMGLGSGLTLWPQPTYIQLWVWSFNLQP